jgi:hypothetical protein
VGEEGKEIEGGEEEKKIEEEGRKGEHRQEAPTERAGDCGTRAVRYKASLLLHLHP